MGLDCRQRMMPHRRKPVRRVAMVAVIALVILCLPIKASPIQLEVSKSERALRVKDGDKILRTYQVAFGKGGDGTKRRRGDNKTPLGHYKVVEFKTDSRFHFFMQLDYPNVLDGWHGYRNRTISATEFKQIAVAYKNKTVPPQNTALGGYIGIHGIGTVTDRKIDIQESYDWTEGCIALKNEDINELRHFVSIGTEVIIKQ